MVVWNNAYAAMSDTLLDFIVMLKVACLSTYNNMSTSCLKDK